MKRLILTALMTLISTAAVATANAAPASTSATGFSANVPRLLKKTMIAATPKYLNRTNVECFRANRGRAVLCLAALRGDCFWSEGLTWISPKLAKWRVAFICGRSVKASQEGNVRPSLVGLRRWGK